MPVLAAMGGQVEHEPEQKSAWNDLVEGIRLQNQVLVEPPLRPVQ